MLTRVLAAIMEAEVSELTGAAHGEPSEDRATHRNGYRERRFDTGLGSSMLRIACVRDGSYMPSFLKARQRSDDALVVALVECYQQGVSTRKAEAIAQALGVEQISKSTVSRMLAALDPQVDVFRSATCRPARMSSWTRATRTFHVDDGRRFAPGDEQRREPRAVG